MIRTEGSSHTAAIYHPPNKPGDDAEGAGRHRQKGLAIVRATLFVFPASEVLHSRVDHKLEVCAPYKH